jgi:transcriptional regulator with PAS, ATPase and Fis domain
MTSFVYALMRGERIMYIGSSYNPTLRAGAMKRRGRQFDHLMILSTHEDRYEAFREEDQMIKLHQPEWNIRGRACARKARRESNPFRVATLAFQRQHIEEARVICHDDFAAAQALGISLATLYRKLGIKTANSK